MKLSDDGGEQVKLLLNAKLRAFGNNDVTKNIVFRNRSVAPIIEL